MQKINNKIIILIIALFAVYSFGVYSKNSNIRSNGFSYHSGSINKNVSWISHPHFYKMGKLIVQYVGTDRSILSDLSDIFGEQFIGD